MRPPTQLPGWYQDPNSPAVARWWDGERWTDQTQPINLSRTAMKKPLHKQPWVWIVGGILGLALIGSVLPGDDSASAPRPTIEVTTSAPSTPTPEPTLSPTPKTTVSSTSVTTSSPGPEVKPTPTPQPTLTPTPDIKSSPVPQAKPTPTPQATPTPTQQAKPTPTPQPTPTPTPETKPTPPPPAPQGDPGHEGEFKAKCKDGTFSYSQPGAPDYRGMCSHHGGIDVKLGRQ
jgi:hypothetical protein